MSIQSSVHKFNAFAVFSLLSWSVWVSPTAAYPQNAGELKKRADALFEKKDFDGAAREYREALRKSPKDADLHIGLAAVLAGKNDLDGAIAELREAIRLKPDYAGAHYLLGSFLLEKMTWAVPSRLCARPLALTPPPRRRNTNWAGRSIDRETWRGPLAPTAKPYG